MAYGSTGTKGGCLLIIHEPLDVTSRLACPDFSRRDADPPSSIQFAEFVLTKSLEGACVIEAEYLLGERTPTLWRHRVRNTRDPVTVIAETPARFFRTILAYFGAKYLDGQVYGGCVRRVLQHGDTRRTIVIHVGNEQAAGFWIRLVSGMPTDR